MKRFICYAFVASALAAFAHPVQAQFGFKGGINLTKFVGGDAEESDSKTKLNLGASIPLFKLGPISIVPEIYYAQKGGTQKTTLANVATMLDFSLDYVEVPILAKLTIPLAGGLRAYLAGGPAFAWKLECKVSAIGVTGAAGAQEDCGLAQFSSFDAAKESADRGIVGNGGLEFQVGGLGWVNLDARLVRGLKRLGDSDSNAEVKNQAFSLMLGYSLGR